jgi:hypothetical protein
MDISGLSGDTGKPENLRLFEAGSIAYRLQALDKMQMHT